MALPLLVPGHPMDNPPTADLWPHLAPDLHPLFAAEDGEDVAGPLRFSSVAVVRADSSADDTALAPSETINGGELALTDSRVLFMGPPGAGVAADRRMIGQFRLVWLVEVEYIVNSSETPELVVLTGFQVEDDKHWTVHVPIRLARGVDARALAEDIARRAARQQFRLDLVAPADREFMIEAAQVQFPHGGHDWGQPFPRAASIKTEVDYRQGGRSLDKHLVQMQLRREEG